MVFGLRALRSDAREVDAALIIDVAGKIDPATFIGIDIQDGACRHQTFPVKLCTPAT